uniref:Amine oxidase domain-containing protein n=1 Tax=Setaria viridis TaxID=4556 RepID=A0A4U6SXV6_SETVI|nr:hypothetical protein SEVIR_9G252900v2 [Setaria viridis]
MKAKVIIISVGMSGISSVKQLSDAGITDLLVLEATDRIGGRIRKTEFAGMNIEMGANWVEGVADQGEARNDILSKKKIDLANEVQKKGNKISEWPRSYDISVMAMQRFFEHIPYGPTRPVDMVIDYYMNDYEFAEPPRVTSVQNTHRLPTFAKFAENVYFVVEQRGYESVVHYIAGLNAVQEITYSQDRVTVKTENGLLYEADYVMVSVSLGVLQSNLTTFSPPLPEWKTLAIYKFDMAVYTKIFLKFPKKYWPVGSGIEFFLYASSRRGHYPIWQGKKTCDRICILLITIMDDESRRIEQQSYEQTKAEAMEVLKKMFPDRDVPNVTDIFVPWWWSDKFFKGSLSNGVNGYEYDQIRDLVQRVHFMGEHTSEHYNGYVHGAYLAGKHSENILMTDDAKREKNEDILCHKTINNKFRRYLNTILRSS